MMCVRCRNLLLASFKEDRDDRAAWISVVRIYIYIYTHKARWTDLNCSGKEASSSGQESLLARGAPFFVVENSLLKHAKFSSFFHGVQNEEEECSMRSMQKFSSAPRLVVGSTDDLHGCDRGTETVYHLRPKQPRYDRPIYLCARPKVG